MTNIIIKELEPHLKQAEREGVLASGQAQKLATYLKNKLAHPQASTQLEQPVPQNFAQSGGNAPNADKSMDNVIARVFPEINTERNEDTYTQVEKSEMPRFVRGFHDVLITIGLVLLLLGLAFFQLNPLMAILVIWGLAEYFVKRQNLALPTFVLSIAYASVVLACIYTLTYSLLKSTGNETFLFSSIYNGAHPLIYLLGELIMLGLYYWRFKVPMVLAALIACLVLFAAFFISSVLTVFMGDLGPRALSVFFLLPSALLLFFIALKFDASDRHRATRRSDVAFWLHMITAPLLLYGLLGSLISAAHFVASGYSSTQMVIVLATVTILMLIGVILDRRAFVTTGLVSLGAAIYYLNYTYGFAMETGDYVAITLVMVGIIVLVLGSGWSWLRRLIVPKMPISIQNRVPLVEV